MAPQVLGISFPGSRNGRGTTVARRPPSPGISTSTRREDTECTFAFSRTGTVFRSGGPSLPAAALGLRLGWRVHLLSDRGLVDGVVHTDVFTGPYTGVSLAL